jgi:hypothetical protein
MRRIKKMINLPLTRIVFFLSFIFFTIACSTEFNEPVLVSSSRGFISRVDGKEVEFRVSSSDLVKSPSWRVGNKLPLSIEQAVSIAKLEIKNYSDEEKLWHLTSFSFNQLDSEDKWFYAIQFNKKLREGSEMDSDDYLIIPILFEGNAIEGKLR